MEGRYVHMEGGIYGWGDNYVEESIHGRKVHAKENTHMHRGSLLGVEPSSPLRYDTYIHQAFFPIMYIHTAGPDQVEPSPFP